MPGRLDAVAAAALAFASAGAVAVLHGSLAVLPHVKGGQIAIPIAVGAPLLLAGAAVLAVLVVLRPARVAALVGADPGALARRRVPVVVLLAGVAGVAALLLASDVWAYTTLRWAVPHGAPVFVG